MRGAFVSRSPAKTPPTFCWPPAWARRCRSSCGSAGQRWTWVGDGQGGNYLRTTDLAARSKADSGRPRFRRQRDQGRPRGFGAVIDAIAQRLAQDADLVVVLFDEDGRSLPSELGGGGWQVNKPRRQFPSS